MNNKEIEKIYDGYSYNKLRKISIVLENESNKPGTFIIIDLISRGFKFYGKEITKYYYGLLIMKKIPVPYALMARESKNFLDCVCSVSHYYSFPYVRKKIFLHKVMYIEQYHLDEF